jgi:hypothetical protein
VQRKKKKKERRRRNEEEEEEEEEGEVYPNCQNAPASRSQNPPQFDLSSKP